MAVMIQREERVINSIRRDNKRRLDVMKRKALQNELKNIFNDFYRDQVMALYKEVYSAR